MLHPARVITFLVVLALCLVARGFRDEEEAAAPPPRDPAFSATTRHNVTVVTELGARWRTLPEVRETQAGYDEAARLVTATAVCDKCDRRQLADRLARDIWVSELRDVRRFRVLVAHDADRGHPLAQDWDPVRDARTLFDRYGNGLVDPDRPAA